MGALEGQDSSGDSNPHNQQSLTLLTPGLLTPGRPTRPAETRGCLGLLPWAVLPAGRNPRWPDPPDPRPPEPGCPTCPTKTQGDLALLTPGYPTCPTETRGDPSC